MFYSIQHIAAAANAQLVTGNAPANIEHLLTDSRRIVFPASSLFFALHSPVRDGHNFIAEVYERGVRNFCVHEGFDHSIYPEANFLLVADTLAALQQVAASHRSQFNYPVIGITGSNGKTVVKEWLYQLLSPDFTIVRSPRSYNSQIGVPLSVWNMDSSHTLGIFEAGISLPGEMAKLAGIIQPTIGVFTNIGDAHAEGFESIEQKAGEKAKLFATASQVVFNGDDSIVGKAVAENATSANSFTWGKTGSPGLKISSINKAESATTITGSIGAQTATISIPFTDDASVENAVTCWCVCLLLKLPQQAITARMQLLQPVDMRLQLLPAINNCAVINDSYSFDLNAFHIALDFLLQQNRFTQHTVILSDLPEHYSIVHYRQVLALLQSKKVKRLITVGPRWKEYKGVDALQTEHFDTTSDFIHRFNTTHFRNEVILLKGARFFEFEKLLPLFDRKVHQTVLEINLTAIAHNLKQYRQQLKPETKLMAMVKAYGYGSGSAEVANLLQFQKVDYLAVAYADEGIELRKAGISLPIMILNVDEAAFEALVEYNLEPEIFSFEILQLFLAFVQQQGLRMYPVHIKLDTGMHRLGFEEKDMAALTALLTANSQLLSIKSVLSHLAASEDAAHDAFTVQQIAIFKRCCAQIEAACGYPFIQHIANSAAIFRHTNAQFNMVRLGIGLYGVDSSGEHQLELQTVATLKTTIAQLRHVKAGETVGYNRRGKLNRDSVIATIRIGYADGFSRKLGNGNGHVYINGQLAPVTGSVCMDMTMVDVTDIPGAVTGGQVEIFGPHLPIQQVAQWCGTISYEVLTGVNQRVKRIYVEE
ncbi:bifunctional UDP-N-acetylmuramoyl-tripeptide:D-alanyl-D-alanine ligase/alanine racemase [Foetidibacter luteolus]|uniref:bifunctional UDP-N-acetylmuramoyl-tripeptide:D-alanyl-D-alanine ligase/alanine racemase n=1 Tax=Foetidibacter luteolus TaxID=2608880 RepID=UPI001A98F93E|nr:bifunctional UDP-N-acetylmuramoyl-tripeptide:D-alanyl-D-alanine ligase/alanine racemase [Foetidibacter luteolus]